MTTKKCSVCLTEKDSKDFFDKRLQCKKCKSDYSKKYKTIKPWMNWNNHGCYNPSIWKDNDNSTWTWQIDHIIPHSTFKYTSMNDQAFKECWALSNLRPYSAKQNIIDGTGRVRHILKVTPVSIDLTPAP